MEPKEKSEWKMFIWFVVTEPARKIKRIFNKAGKVISVENILYVLAFMTIIVFINNWRNILWIIAAAVIIVVGLSLTWRKKKFIHEYRKEKYKG
jgi:hypothetical protein